MSKGFQRATVFECRDPECNENDYCTGTQAAAVQYVKDMDNGDTGSWCVKDDGKIYCPSHNGRPKKAKSSSSGWPRQGEY